MRSISASSSRISCTARAVRDWQGYVLDLVRSQGQGKRRTARYLAFGVNGLGLMVMIVVFAHTAGVTGAEALDIVRRGNHDKAFADGDAPDHGDLWLKGIAAGFIDRTTRGAYSEHGLGRVTQRIVRIPGRVLDGNPGNPPSNNLF